MRSLNEYEYIKNINYESLCKYGFSKILLINDSLILSFEIVSLASLIIDNANPLNYVLLKQSVI